MSKYIKIEDLKWHSPDESIAGPLTEFYVTESDIADLPAIDIVHCGECENVGTEDCPIDEVYRDDFCCWGIRRKERQ